MPPFFSIIVPSLNQSRFLDHCLKSVLSQTGPSWELIVVDGGSGREVMEILESYQEHFAHFISEPDKGQSDALNKGFSLAAGTLVAWLNCDDFYEPGALEAVKEAFDREPGRPFYAGGGYRTDEEGKKREPFYPSGFRLSRQSLRYGENEILQPAAFIDREKLSAIGNRLDPDLHYALDTDLWLRLTDLGDPLFVEKPIANLREHEETKSAQGGWPRFEEIRRVAQKHTGINLTPGALHVLAATLCKELSNPELSRLLSPLLAEKATELWEQTGHSLKMLNGGGEDLAESSSKTPAFPIEGETAQETDRLRKFISVLEEDRRERGKQIERLTEVLVQSEEQRIDLTRDIERLNQLIREFEEDRRAQFDQLNLLLKDSENDRAARLQNNDRLTQLIQDLEVDKKEALGQSEKQWTDLTRHIEQLNRLLKDSENDRVARLENNDKLTQLIHDLEVDKQEQIARLRQEIRRLRRPWYRKVAEKLTQRTKTD